MIGAAIPRALLCDADFPVAYADMKHPTDYTLQDEPFEPSFVVNQRQGHAKLIFRVCWEVQGKFMPMSFIVDTGAVHPIYFGSVGMRLMEAHQLLLLDELGNDVVTLRRRDGTESSVQYKATPSEYGPANIIGLRFLLRFGLVMDGGAFRFSEPFAYF
jgi:hypothetical protein